MSDWFSNRPDGRGDYLSRKPRPWLNTEEVLEQLGGRHAYKRYIAEGLDEGDRPDLCGSARKARANRRESSLQRSRNLWLGGQVLGKAGFAKRMTRKAENGLELRQEVESVGPEELEALAARAVKKHGITVNELCGSQRPRAVGAARMELVKLAVIERNVRLIDVARYLGIATASVAAYRRKLTN